MRKDQKRDWHGRFVKEVSTQPMTVEDVLAAFQKDENLQSIVVHNEPDKAEVELTWFGAVKPTDHIEVDGSKELDRILNMKAPDNFEELYEESNFWERNGLALMAFIISVVALALALNK